MALTSLSRLRRLGCVGWRTKGGDRERGGIDSPTLSDKTLTHQEARLRLHDHLGENIYAGLQARGESGTVEIFSLHGRLGHPHGERPATSPIPAETRDIFGSTYTIGGRALLLPELPGTITEIGDGIEFELTEGLVLRIVWAANPEHAHGYTHDDALVDLTGHIGKEASVWLTMTDVEGRFWTVLPPLIGILGKHTLGPVEPGVSHEAVVSVKGTLDYAYTVDGKVLNLPPFPGTVSRYEQGIQWLFANGLTLRIHLMGDTDK